MPTPQEAADILRRFLASGSDASASEADPQGISLADLVPDQPYNTQTKTYAPGTPMSVPSHNPAHFPVEPPPAPARPSPFSTQSQQDRMAPRVGGVNIRPGEAATEDSPPTAAEWQDASAGRVAQLLGLNAPTPPDPAESLATLTRDPLRANDPQALASNRRSRQDELEQRISNDKFAAALGPQEGFVPGSPGRRYRSNLPVANLIADEDQAAQLAHEQANDPYTGTAETARVSGIRKVLDDAAMTQRPEVADAAKTLAERNAFAKYMESHGMKLGEKKAEYEAASSPEAYAAALTPLRAAGSEEGQRPKDADLKREQQKMMSPQLVPGQMPIPGREPGQPGSYTSYNPKPFSAADEKSMNAMRGLAPMVADLKSMLDPTNNSVQNKAGQTIRLGLYNMGVSPNIAALGGDAHSQARIQLADLIKVMGASPFMGGSRNYQYMKDIYRHLTNPAATDAFLYGQLNELQKRWPQILDAIVQTHDDPRAGLDFSPTGGGDDVFGTPPTPEEMATAGASNTNERADALLRRR